MKLTLQSGLQSLESSAGMESSENSLGSPHQACVPVANGTPGVTLSSSSQGHVVVNIPTSTGRKVTNEIEADCLEEIESVPRLRLILLDWESKYSESKSRIDRKEALSENVKSEIYNLVGFFSAFQGLVLTAVSQGTALTCHNWWGPFALSLLCSIATLFGVCHKFYNFFTWKRAAERETQHAKVLKRQIHLLKKYGKRFDFAEHAPDINDREEKEKRKKRKSFVNFVVSSRYFILALLVILTMLQFSSIILASTVRILCYSH